MPRRIEFHVCPAYAIGAIAAAVLLVLLSPYRLRPSLDAAPVVAGSALEPRFFVQFRLDAPDATDVRLAGSFTDWQSRYELHQTAAGIWTITLPLSLGVHDYAFVVDGQRWLADPYAQHVDDGFGGMNSRIALLSPDVPRS
ncbi:MAG: glycogen-binding domain-containing protein [Acidobacteriota bacterium]|nr:glycogen-binding domain-containing protein [Acidobacteriota bacterium]